MPLRPLRNLVLVERITEKVSAGGIHFPEDYKARASAKAVNKADSFRARIVAVGPKVSDPLIAPGAEVPILTWAENADGTRRGLYTGIDGPDGLLFVKWPEDFGGVVYASTTVPPQAADAAE